VSATTFVNFLSCSSCESFSVVAVLIPVSTQRLLWGDFNNFLRGTARNPGALPRLRGRGEQGDNRYMPFPLSALRIVPLGQRGTVPGVARCLRILDVAIRKTMERSTPQGIA
jgi:hypothetical protein